MGQGSAELLSNLRVTYPSLMGGNWQRKMWFDGICYWRGRYCRDDDAIKFEHINAAGLRDNVWMENEAARIYASGFTGFDADFTVRGGSSGIPTTIHYSDGVDTWIAESDEASRTGWAWQNLTKIFDGTTPDSYKHANLGADRAESPMLWATAAFVDDGTSKQWVQTKEQTTSGDIKAWDAAFAISDVDNTNTIHGASVRSMGAAEANDIMVVYKEGDALKSRYYTGTWQTIQDIDTSTHSGHACFDFEHGMEPRMGHVLYVDADSTVQWRDRDAGAASTWSDSEQLHGANVSHRGVGIIEQDDGWLWTIWVHENGIEYRMHRCIPETWYPLLADDPHTFDVATDAVVPTINNEQPNTPDHIPNSYAIPICWIGDKVSRNPDDVGWGILVDASISTLKGVFNVRQLTSTNLYARFRVAQDIADLLGKGIIRQSDSAELSTIFWVRHPYRLWTNRRYINGVIELNETLIGNAIFEYVVEGVMEDTQGYLDNAGLSYSEWTNITLVPVQILRAVTYGTVAALYARHILTFRGQVIPSVTPVTVTVIGDAEKAMNYWEERADQMLEFYIASQDGDVMLTSTPDEEPVFSMEDIPEEVTDYVSWRIWLQQRDES